MKPFKKSILYYSFASHFWGWEARWIDKQRKNLQLLHSLQVVAQSGHQDTVTHKIYCLCVGCMPEIDVQSVFLKAHMLWLTDLEKSS